MSTRHHSILPSDNLALVILGNLEILLNNVDSKRTTLEVDWWDVLEKDHDNTEIVLGGLMEDVSVVFLDFPSVLKISVFQVRENSVQRLEWLPNISFHDFSSLGVGRWINDEIINYFVTKWCSQSGNVLGLSTFFASACLFDAKTSCTKAKRYVSDQDEKKVLRWIRRRQVHSLLPLFALRSLIGINVFSESPQIRILGLGVHSYP